MNFLSDYRGKRVLVTGHTGFKGSWLAVWLKMLGADVIGIALDPFSENDNFVLSGIGEKICDVRGDIRKKDEVESVFQEFKPEIVFHLAAQPLVRYSYKNPVETYETNVLGTINVLEAIRKTSETKICICITTDKCYENIEQLEGYKEDDKLGGYDPYSSSKACCEIAINSWRQSYFNPIKYKKHGKSIASVRAGNVIGGGDWALDRIVPDCIKSIENSLDLQIRSPKSIRPWQHVLEPLGGYLLLGSKLMDNPTSYADAWNFGPKNDSIINVWEIAEKIVEYYGKGKLIDVSSPNDLHEAKLLNLNIEKARLGLGWEPKLTVNDTIRLTVDWYKNYLVKNVYDLCVEQISFYQNL